MPPHVLFSLPVVASCFVWYLSIDLPVAIAWVSSRPVRSGSQSHQRRSGEYRLATSRIRKWQVCANKDANQQLDDFESETDPVRRNKIRMDVVRSLQASFYQPTAFYSGEDATADRLTGTPNWDNGVLTNLPVWYVGWTELPGRTNVLSINQPVYTNMFESIIRRHESGPLADQECCYFGHVCRDPNTECTDHYALGTLMRITDYQRMQGGTLLLLVQAMDRFVVTQRLQERPYGIAHVQLVPDREELKATKPLQPIPKDDSVGRDQVSHIQGSQSLWTSWSNWYPYEFKKTSFPWSNTGGMYLDFSDIPGSALNAVLPLAEYDTLNLPVCAEPPSLQATYDGADLEESSSNNSATDCNETTSLEVDLQQKGILNEICLIDTLCNATNTEMEIKLWLLLNDVFAATKISPHPVLLGLIPLDCTWPADFVLGGKVNPTDHAPTSGDSLALGGHGPLSPLYPADRRQKRLSYSAAHVLERVASVTADSEQLNTLRQQLLQIPRYDESRARNLISMAQPNNLCLGYNDRFAKYEV